MPSFWRAAKQSFASKALLIEQSAGHPYWVTSHRCAMASWLVAEAVA
jgi:hypothetical protein